MPVIVRGGGGGSFFKGYAPKPVTGIKAVVSVLEIKLNWTDPEDVVYETATLSKWAKTYLVRKIGEFPENLKDGELLLENTVRNQYQTTSFSDKNNIVEETTYYYRFFTESNTGVINADSSQVVKATASKVSSVLEENSWDLIATIAEEGRAQDYWQVGDEKILTLTNGSESIPMQIWGFNKDPMQGGGKAGITFGSKTLTKQLKRFHSIFRSYPRWAVSDLRTFLNGSSFFGLMPRDLQDRIKTIKTESYRYDYSEYEISYDAIFVPSVESVPKMGNYTIFTDDASYKKKINGLEIFAHYWLRDSEASNQGYVEVITINGNIGNTRCDTDNHICFQFCL